MPWNKDPIIQTAKIPRGQNTWLTVPQKVGEYKAYYKPMQGNCAIYWATLV